MTQRDTKRNGRNGRNETKRHDNSLFPGEGLDEQRAVSVAVGQNLQGDFDGSPRPWWRGLQAGEMGTGAGTGVSGRGRGWGRG